MYGKAKQTILFLLKPKAILFGIAIFLLGQALDHDSYREVCCFDCNWTSRHASFLVIASVGLILSKPWTLFISLLTGVKVAYSVGYAAFLNHAGASDVSSLRWSIIKPSLEDTLTYRPLYFIEIGIAVIIVLWSGVALLGYVFQKLSLRANSI